MFSFISSKDNCWKIVFLKKNIDFIRFVHFSDVFEDGFVKLSAF